MAVLLGAIDRYKKNLRYDHEYIYSYNTKVAEIDHKNRVVKPLGWWSPTTSKHINYVAKELGYKKL
jgi:hypothetical protein